LNNIRQKNKEKLLDKVVKAQNLIMEAQSNGQ